MDSEELEKELDSLLQDSSKDSLDLPPVPQGVPSTAPISDAELEAELEQLSVSAGGGKGSRGPGRELGQPWGSAGLGTVLGGMGIVLVPASAELNLVLGILPGSWFSGAKPTSGRAGNYPGSCFSRA